MLPSLSLGLILLSLCNSLSPTPPTEPVSSSLVAAAESIQPPSEEIMISDTVYEDRPHFFIQTPQASFFYDKAGGGFSRLMDPDGKDWIAYERNPWDQYPASAASAYRGIPNTVFRSEESGAGHPGHDQCESEQEGENTIVSTSLRGKWQWRWTFFANYAELEMLKVPADHPYWFLYEGPVGGSYSPTQSYFGTNQGGPDSLQYDYYKNRSAYGNWRWAYFGRKDQNRVLFLQHMQKDTLTDTFGYLGNTEKGINSPDGMVVFGFGRKQGAQPLMQEPQQFRLGFWEQAVNNEADRKALKKYLRKLK